VAQFLLALLDNSHTKPATSGASTLTNSFNHAKIAIELAHEILANPKQNKELCKVVTHFHITDEDQDLVKVLSFLMEEILEESLLKRDKLIQKGLLKFLASLKRVDRNPEAFLTPSKVGKLREKTKSISANNEKEGDAREDEIKPKPKRAPRTQKVQNKKNRYISDRYCHLRAGEAKGC
jgi:hypothetical protein